MIWAAIIILGGVGLSGVCAAFRDLGYEQGFRYGYEEREAAEKDWWEDAEREVDSARKQIWRETPKKGMWL